MVIEFDDGVPVTSGEDSYGSEESASEYFASRLRTYAWDNATSQDRQKALLEATRAIDRLAFKGAKTDLNQELQFPRNGLETIPNQILWATYEIAIVLLDQLDPEIEIRRLGVTSESYAGVRTTYDRSTIDPWTASGIPSATAWQYLYPFLADTGEINLSRVS